MQDSLFQDPLGQRLRAARERAGLSREQAAQRLRLPHVIVEAMEREDWQRLGAPIYIRANLSAYLNLLGLPAALVEGPVNMAATPRLEALERRPRLQQVFERGVRNLVYLTMTAVIAVPAVWLATHYQSGSPMATVSLEPDAIPSVDPFTLPEASPDESIAPGDEVMTALAASDANGEVNPPQEDDADTPAEVPLPAAASAPVMAAMASFPRPALAAARQDVLRLVFREASWLEVLGADGRRIERDLVPAGSEREYPISESLRITLGDADAVEVRRGTERIDLTPFRSAKVARFAVSSADVSPAAR